jgi:ABC-type transport system involved in multi-copper enzyme maturation permease subunit
MMFWHIAKRDIYDNMTSLRFGFTVILLVLLMVINAVTFITTGYGKRTEQYREQTARSLDKLRGNCSSVYNLSLEGPGDMCKKPSPLTFCADGGEENISDKAEGRNPHWSSTWGLKGKDGKQYSAKGFWRMYYPHFDVNIKNTMPGYLKIDWVFIIGVLVSFACILFTFDAISGEKERGTLRLTLAGSVPRSSVIMGKFAGAFISVILPLSIAILLNLLIISVSGAAQLDAGHWSRIGMIALISAVYVAIFICLGIFVSARCSRSSTSLLVLLLIWVIFVVLMPNILGSISSDLRKVSSADEVSRRNQSAKDDLWKGYRERGLFETAPSRENPDMGVMRLWAECLNEERRTEERIMDEHLNDQLAQIQLARQITRISPTAIYKYALESMSNTGFERHRKFIANVRKYRDTFWDYIKSEDRKDPDSLHVYFVREGVSDKPANFDNAPRFVENLILAGALGDALLDIAILLFFVVFFFMAAYISFIRADVK